MLKDEYFVFTGTLTTMTRKQAQFIITGLKGYHPSQKIREAEETIQVGQQIKIMSEKEFIEFLAQTFQLLTKEL